MVAPFLQRNAIGSINRLKLNFEVGCEETSSSLRLTCNAQHERPFTDSEEALWCSCSCLGIKRRGHCAGTATREVAHYFAGHLNEPHGLMESGGISSYLSQGTMIRF